MYLQEDFIILQASQAVVQVLLLHCMTDLMIKNIHQV